ncbi:hypothetical protein [Hymenobacter algoricola]|uniref:NERD domain-containing protein n=1 Tax=Hymenobacter algoricola TaxID=486267 RepID=A0ABP7NAQ7_9BACT
MLHSFLYAPFAAAARQAQFDAAQTVLEQEDRPGTALLLGNLTVAGETLDAVLVRADGVTVLAFLPGGGRLTISPTTADSWQLNGQPLPDERSGRQLAGQFARQQPALAAWLADQLGTPVAPAAVAGVVAFESPVAFGPAVAAFLAGHNFQLAGSLPQLPALLGSTATPGPLLSEAVLQAWARELGGAEAAADEEPPGFWEHKARQLWRWLGAEDIPPDAPYGQLPADPVAASQQEKQRLEQIRQQVRAEVQAQSQAAAAREAEREHTIAQLRAQLAQAAAVPAETAALHARLAAETRQKTALEAAVRTAQAESVARSARLEERIDQLGQLIQQLQAAPRSPKPPAPAAPHRSGTAATAPRAARRPSPPARRWRLQWSRVAVVAAGLGWSGAAVWGLTQLTRQLVGPPKATEQSAPAARPADPAADVADPAPDAVEPGGMTSEPAGIDSVAARPPEPRDSSEILAPVNEPDLDDTAPGT